MNDSEFLNFLYTAVPSNRNVHKYMMVTRNRLRQYKKIAVAVSGGSDSDIMLDMIELVKPPDGCGEVRYVFFDTGLEYDATLRHIAEVEERYGVIIKRVKSKKSISVACREHGVPFISKYVSEMMCRLQKHNFDWNDMLENATTEKYGRCKSALDWYFNRYTQGISGKSNYNINRLKLLREFIMANPPGFAISEKCCDYAKKNVAKEFDKIFKPDLKINGMRMTEGGRRAGAIKNCFTIASDTSVANYRPLWYWSDEDKRIYKEWRSIRYSDCYEVWGFNRTGCVGCPCNSKALQELEIAKRFEPNKVKAAFSVFEKSYAYREAYVRFKKNNKNSQNNQ
jgi:3'-phosphoadenosine 5'-phosphosulfate sulfotransferase (PAPS reductase)/FAD synthetase